MAGVEERLAVLEEIVRGMRAEEGRTRERLHKLEGVTQGLVDLQRELHRANEARIRRQTVAIERGGLAMSIAMVLLAVVTLVLK